MKIPKFNMTVNLPQFHHMISVKSCSLRDAWAWAREDGCEDSTLGYYNLDTVEMWLNSDREYNSLADVVEILSHESLHMACGVYKHHLGGSIDCQPAEEFLAYTQSYILKKVLERVMRPARKKS